MRSFRRCRHRCFRGPPLFVESPNRPALSSPTSTARPASTTWPNRWGRAWRFRLRQRRRPGRLPRAEWAAGRTGGAYVRAILPPVPQRSRGGSGRKRTLRFTDVTERAGSALRDLRHGRRRSATMTTTATSTFRHALDPTTLFHNNGDGTFTDVTAPGGCQRSAVEHERGVHRLRPRRPSRSLRRDYLDFSLASNKVCHDAVGARDYCSPRSYHPVPDRLFRNDGNGRFPT